MIFGIRLSHHRQSYESLGNFRPLLVAIKVPSKSNAATFARPAPAAATVPSVRVIVMRTVGNTVNHFIRVMRDLSKNGCMGVSSSAKSHVPRVYLVLYRVVYGMQRVRYIYLAFVSCGSGRQYRLLLLRSCVSCYPLVAAAWGEEERISKRVAGVGTVGYTTEKKKGAMYVHYGYMSQISGTLHHIGSFFHRPSTWAHQFVYNKPSEREREITEIMSQTTSYIKYVIGH